MLSLKHRSQGGIGGEIAKCVGLARSMDRDTRCVMSLNACAFFVVAPFVSVQRSVRACGRVLRRLAAICSVAVVLLAAAVAQADRPVRAVDGSLVLAGSKAVCDGGIDAFVHLCGGGAGRVVVLEQRGSAWVAARLAERGAVAVESLRLSAKDLRKGTDAWLLLLAADGVWLEDAASPMLQDRMGRALLENVLRRGGVLGGAGAAAVELLAAPSKSFSNFL